jgi:hypothetical protein
MHATVGVQPEEMQRACLVTDASCHGLMPDLGLEDRAVAERTIHKLGALCKDSACAESVVPDFAIAHIIVRGQANRRPMRSQLGVQLATG